MSLWSHVHEDAGFSQVHYTVLCKPQSGLVRGAWAFSLSATVCPISLKCTLAQERVVCCHRQLNPHTTVLVLLPSKLQSTLASSSFSLQSSQLGFQPVPPSDSSPLGQSKNPVQGECLPSTLLCDPCVSVTGPCHPCLLLPCSSKLPAPNSQGCSLKHLCILQSILEAATWASGPRLPTCPLCGRAATGPLPGVHWKGHLPLLPSSNRYWQLLL